MGQVRERLRLRSRLYAVLPHGPRIVRDAGFDAVDEGPLQPGIVAELLESHTGPLVHKWTQYPAIYDELLTEFRQGFTGSDGSLRPLRFLEIGVSEGGSLSLWRRFFGPEAVITGVDVDPTCADRVPPEVARIRIGSQADPGFLRDVVAEMGGVDVVLDDGSHVATHQRASLEVLWPLLSDNGLYLCEDTHTSYWANHEGGLRRPGTAIEVAKDAVDDLHHWYFQVLGESAPARPERPDLWSVTFYDSVIAMRKRTRPAPRRFTRGTDVRSAD